MRTTIRLGGELLELAKRRAAEQGRSLTALIEDALIAELGRPHEIEITSADVPIWDGGKPLPGIDLIKTSALEDEMDLERWKP